MKHSLALLLAMAVLLAWFTPAVRGATDAEIDQAIQDGLAWLATQQKADGSFGSGYYLANTAAAVLAFENEGHFPGGGTAYSTNVEKGLYYIFECARRIGINPQTYGYPGRNDDPDTNGNGQGVYFSEASNMYETGLVMQALAASNTPDRVVADVDYTAMAAGDWHSLALKTDGSIKSWGANRYGQVSDTPAGYDFTAVAAGLHHSLALKADDSIVGWGLNNQNGQASPPAGTNFVAIAAGAYHSLALKADGSIVGWGRNYEGQINVPAGNDYVTIAAGYRHSLALKADGSIVGWGNNGHGQATPPAGTDFVAIAGGWFHSLALKADGSITGWGDNSLGQATPPVGSDFVAIAAGSGHSLALKADGSIVGWGYNGYGQASPPAGYDFVAIVAGARHSLALKADGSIVGWGYNWKGQATPPPVGACGGMTYEEVMTDLVDFLAWAQTDEWAGRGGWRYQACNNQGADSDNSVAQWPVLGLVAAEQWGIKAPQFVKDEMEHWVTYIQNTNGASGYYHPTNYNNISKTGGLLVEFYYLGDDKNTQRAQAARSYINSRWNIAPQGIYYGNKGHPYAMFSVFKGLELMQVLTVPNAPANPDTPAGDWWGDYCEYLVNTQTHPEPGLGYWGGYSYWGQYLATPWYIIILQASVFPISVDIVVPGAACDLTGYEVDVHYSVARFEASGTLRVYRDDVLYDTVTLTDFKGEATVIYDLAPETVGSHIWKAVLDVTGGGITTRAEDTDTSTVYLTPQVTDIPDRFSPFETFDLDDYQTCECTDVDWTALGVPEGWTVTIDAENVVTVTALEGATDPADITFQATFHWPGIDCIDSDTVTFSLNRPPVADPGRDYFAGEKYYVGEGGLVELDGTQSYDPDGDAITYVAWDLDGDCVYGETGADALNGDETGYTPTFSAALLDGKVDVYIFLKVCDEHGACNIGMAEVEVQNVAPTVEAVNAPIAPVNINDQPVSVEVTFSDPGIPDTHEVTWDWGDESGDIQPDATSPASQEHTYAEPGVYTVTVTVTDDDGGTVSQTYEFIVIYDTSAGFVTGGGWIDSPEGAYKPEPSLTGKANFGFVSKYKEGANVPTGQTEFQFKTAGLNFHSSSYEWLVVTGSDFARYKGSGTINGTGDYNFMLWAGDSEPDTFRIKIWEENEEGVETVIYDNGLNQAIGGGSIVVHCK